MTEEQTTYSVREQMVTVAIDRIREFCPAEGYYLAFSGGKDSIVIKRLAQMADVPFDAHFEFTTIDPPEVLRYIREHHPNVLWNYPAETMWQLIVRKRMPPTRRVRYCCEELKERGGSGRFVLLGVRWAESERRANRRLFETCTRDRTRHLINPIIDWSDQAVWDFIREQGLPYCSLYDEGQDRIGCIMCPCAEKRRHQDAERWPQYKRAYIRAFQRMVDKRIADGLKTTWRTGEDVYDWWMTEPKRKGRQPEGCSLFE
jgi:phosphoadenosine phosphosulfate reductase